MSKSLFSAVVVAGLMVCSSLSAAVSTSSMSAAAGTTRVVTMPTVTVTGKRDTATEIVTMPAVTVIAHRATAVLVASR